MKTERSQAGTGGPLWTQERRMYMVSPLRVDMIGFNIGSATYQLNGLGLVTHALLASISCVKWKCCHTHRWVVQIP